MIYKNYRRVFLASDRIFREYAQSVLFANYHNGAPVLSVDDIVARCEVVSEAVRAKYDYFLDILYRPINMKKFNII
jgi:hypothetical protein